MFIEVEKLPAEIDTAMWNHAGGDQTAYQQLVTVAMEMLDLHQAEASLRASMKATRHKGVRYATLRLELARVRRELDHRLLLHEAAAVLARIPWKRIDAAGT